MATSTDRRLVVALGLVGALSILVPDAAHACGVSTADGLSACSFAEHEEETRPRWHVGAAGIYTSTAIDFSNNQRMSETRSSLVASLAYHPTTRLTYQLAAGGTLGGRLQSQAGVQDFSSGVTAAVGGSYRIVDSPRPFVVLTGNLSFSRESTTLAGMNGMPDVSAAYSAFDLRVGALVGTTLWKILSPYAVARAFGGPIYWKYQGNSVTGTDAHHYQLGAGATLVVARRFNVFAEGIPVGERSAAVGTGFAF